MTLSESDIRDWMQASPSPITRAQGAVRVEPSSVDLHLGDELVRLTTDEPVDVTDPETYPEPEPAGFVIPPRSFRLAETEERVDLPNDLVGFLWGRSSVGRLGLFAHNAGLIDAGFSGTLTLELINAASYPIKLKPGMRIVQMTLHEHDTPPETGYGTERGSKYDGQEGVTASRLSEDFND